MDTLLLDSATWDLCLDAGRNIALASSPYSLAQDAASAIRTFLGEVYYDTAQGVPYFQRVLGHFPSAQYLKGQLVARAMTVPGVVAARVYFTGLVDRQLSGQVQVTDQAGKISNAGF